MLASLQETRSLALYERLQEGAVRNMSIRMQSAQEGSVPRQLCHLRQEQVCVGMQQNQKRPLHQVLQDQTSSSLCILSASHGPAQVHDCLLFGFGSFMPQGLQSSQLESLYVSLLESSHSSVQPGVFGASSIRLQERVRQNGADKMPRKMCWNIQDSVCTELCDSTSLNM
jgi:hypothetical protein